jgi:ABC-type glucose/galactose transport system permease subunit
MKRRSFLRLVWLGVLGSIFAKWKMPKPVTWAPATAAASVAAYGGSADAAATAGVNAIAATISVYTFTDLKALTRHLASLDGKKIIYDTNK